jgi:hypothetical protein
MEQFPPAPEHDDSQLKTMERVLRADVLDASLLAPYLDRMQEVLNGVETPRFCALRTQWEAAQILEGGNIIGIPELEKYFGRYSPEQLAGLSCLPFSPETLQECKDTHVLVARAPVSPLQMLEARPSVLCADQRARGDRGRLSPELLGNVERVLRHSYPDGVPPTAGWALIRPKALPGSQKQTRAEQLARLAREFPREYVPSLADVLPFSMVHMLRQAKRRCSGLTYAKAGVWLADTLPDAAGNPSQHYLTLRGIGRLPGEGGRDSDVGLEFFIENQALERDGMSFAPVTFPGLAAARTPDSRT